MENILMMEFVDTLIYGVLGIIFMFVGYKFFDFITPYNFAKEVEEKNPAIGIVIFGIFLAIAIITRASIM